MPTYPTAIEIQVRQLLRDLVCLRRSEDDVGSELLKLMERELDHLPPDTGVSLDAQIEWLEAVTQNVSRLFDPVMQPIAQTKLTAALETLRWVKSENKAIEAWNRRHFSEEDIRK